VIVEDQTSGRVEIPLDGIVKSNLEADVDSELRRKRDQKIVDRELIKNSAR